MNEIKIIEVENEDVVITVDGAENEDVVIALDGSVACWSEIYGDPKKSKALMTLLDELLKLKVDSNELIVGDTKCKITYDEKGLVISGEDLTIDDLPELLLAHIKDVIATAEEVNILHGIKITTEELNRLKGLLVTAEELNKLVGLDISIDDLNSVVNKLDKNPPITAGTYTKVKVDEKGLVVQGQNLSEADIPSISLGKVYDVTVSNNVLNKLTGLEVGATELNQLKNIEGNVQTQINKYIGIIPDEATIDNQLADKQFVRDWVYDHAGYYVTKMPNGKPFTNKQELIDTITFYHLGEVKRLSENDFAIVENDETQGYQMAMYIYDRDEIYNEGHWILQYVIPHDTGVLTNIVMNGELQPVTDGVVNLGTVITKHQDISGKQDVISDLETIRQGAELGSTALQSYTETDPVYTADKPNIATKDELTQGLSIKQDIISDLESIRTGAELGSTALQSVPDEYITETELNAKGYLTSYTETDPVYTADKPYLALKSELPTKVSSLINDADYQTATDVASMIASIPQFEIMIVDVLPTEGQKMVLYLIPKTSASGDNIYDEYIWLESTSSFELVGSTAVDLSDYYSKTETNELLNAKQDSISDLEAIRSGASLGSTALQSVPDEYITETELNAKGYLTSYTETDPVYTADKPYLALKSELPIIPTNVSEFNNDAGYITNTVNDLVNYTSTTALTDLLSKKQDTLVNQENIKSVNNQSLLGSGNLDIENVQNITYAELLSLKNNGQLKKGLFYRITDYVTTTNGASANSAEPSRSAGHQFDIIVQALGTSDLSEICTACLHEGDTYFINDNLSGWQIWYDINNDTTKYAWADTTNGKGVIYRLIDEKGNECPYDFKNIQFYRNPSNYSDIKSLLTVSDGYYYTFSHYTSSTTVEDWTLGTAGTKFNFENKLGQCSDRQSDNSKDTKVKKLNNSLFILTQSSSRMTRNSWGVTAYNNTMVTTDMFNNSVLFNFSNNISNSAFQLNNMGVTVNNNKFLGDFTTNYISGSFNSNTIKAFMSENVFYMYFYNNTVNKQFAANIILYSCQNNTFSGDFMFNVTSPAFSRNTLNANFTYNFTSPTFQDNTISGELKRNRFGVRFRYNNVKSMLGNDIGNNVTYCTFGDGFNYNNVSSNAYYCTFGDYNTNNTVEPSIGYIKTASGTYGVNLGLSNSTIKAGVIGSSSTNLLDLTALPTNTSYPMIIEKDVNGKVLATWSDKGATKGKYKESITATEWNDIVPDYYTTTEIDTKIGDISSLLDSINGEV